MGSLSQLAGGNKLRLHPWVELAAALIRTQIVRLSCVAPRVVRLSNSGQSPFVVRIPPSLARKPATRCSPRRLTKTKNMKTTKLPKTLTVTALAFALAAAADAAQVTFSAKAPALGADDIANLSGADTEIHN